MKIKRTVCLLVALMMLLILAACGEGGDVTSVGDTSSTAEVSGGVTSTVSSEEPSVSDISVSASEEESSDVSVEESSEESSAPEADYIVEDMYYAGYTLISRVVDDDNVEQKRLYGLSLYDYLDNNNKILLQPEFDIIYAGFEHNMIIAVKLNTEIYGSDHSEVYVYNGNLQCIGKYYSIYYGGAYRGRSTVDFYVYQNEDGTVVALGNDGMPLFENITNVFMPNYMNEKYLYFETTDGKCYIAERRIVNDASYDDQHIVYFYEVENIEKFTEKNFPLMLEVGEPLQLRFRGIERFHRLFHIRDPLTMILYYDLHLISLHTAKKEYFLFRIVISMDDSIGHRL